MTENKTVGYYIIRYLISLLIVVVLHFIGIFMLITQHFDVILTIMLSYWWADLLIALVVFAIMIGGLSFFIAW